MKEYGCCTKCQDSWEFGRYHPTFISDGSGMFPLCETCWSALTPQERLPYYEELFHRYSPRSFTLEQLREAVLNEGIEVGK